MEFQWEDPLLLEQQLSAEELSVRDTVRRYCREQLLPRAQEGFKDGFFHAEFCRRWAHWACWGPLSRVTAAPV